MPGILVLALASVVTETLHATLNDDGTCSVNKPLCCAWLAAHFFAYWLVFVLGIIRLFSPKPLADSFKSLVFSTSKGFQGLPNASASRILRHNAQRYFTGCTFALRLRLGLGFSVRGKFSGGSCVCVHGLISRVTTIFPCPFCVTLLAFAFCGFWSCNNQHIKTIAMTTTILRS